MGPEVLGLKVLGLVVTVAKYLGNNALGQEVIEAQSTGAGGSGAGSHWGLVSGAQRSGAPSSRAGKRVSKTCQNDLKHVD